MIYLVDEVHLVFLVPVNLVGEVYSVFLAN